jgi:transcriptional regulator with XRE-family HTH domain
MAQLTGKERLAPLKFPADRTELIRRATEFSDGCISVGGLAYGEPKPRERPRALPAFARLVELMRRELKQSVEELAVRASVDVTDVLALELGRPMPKREVIERLAEVFGVDREPLLQLAGFVPTSSEQLSRLAALFSARLEPNEPLKPQEEQVLKWFRQEAFSARRDQVEVG